MFRSRLSRRAGVTALAAVFATTALAPVAEAKPPRPSKQIVKKAFTTTWDTEFENVTGGEGTIKLRFLKIRYAKTRRSGRESITIPYGTWITPVKVVFLQTITRTTEGMKYSSPYIPDEPDTRSVTVNRVVAAGNFYKGDFGWEYVPKGAKSKQISYREG